MSKRRINKQQQRRIDQKQSDLTECDISNVQKGFVLCRYGKRAEIEDEEGKIIQCAIKPTIESLVAGDKVLWQISGETHGIVVSRLERKSVLERPDFRNKPKAVAANVTRFIIVIAPEPEISWSLLDSYLVMAKLLNIQPIIVFNKSDLVHPTSLDIIEHDYKPLGHQILYTSKFLPESLVLLKESLKNEVSVFIGQSGVGKSTLISELIPEMPKIKTSPLSENVGLGRHTTSNSRYYKIPQGGALIDSPGVRAFSMGNVGARDILRGYSDLYQFAQNCKFRNCIHIDEKICGIVQAVNNGDVPSRRYQNYLKLIESSVQD